MHPVLGLRFWGPNVLGPGEAGRMIFSGPLATSLSLQGHPGLRWEEGEHDTMQKRTHKHASRKAIFGALALAAAMPWTMAAWTAAQDTQNYHPRRTTVDPPVPAVGKLGQDLFFAIERRDAQAVKELLAQGADPNSRNGLELTPLYLAAASHQPEVMKLLLEAKAQPNTANQYGNPLSFAAATGHLEGVRMLLAKGADPNNARVDGTTVLMMAANAGHPGVVAELLKHKANANETNNSGATALSYAARAGHVEAGKALLAAGAKPNHADEHGRTPLMDAALANHAEFVKMLLSRGAKVNAKDAQGRTALHLSAAYGNSAEVVQTLLAGGADAKLRDASGRTAGEYAALRGGEATARLLGKAPLVPKTSPDEAVVKSVKLLEKSMVAFNERTQCISCHQEGLGRMVTGVAKSKGLATSGKLEDALLGRIRGALAALQPLHEGALKDPEVMKQVPLIEINEVNSGYGWMMAGMAFRGDAPSAASAAMASVLARQQSPDGSWTFTLPRVPMQSSPHTYTALAVLSVSRYAPAIEAQETAARLARAKAWFLHAPASSSDDLAFRLLGLKWAGASSSERQKAVAELRAAQKPDGGWSQLPAMASDAYATGQALYALRVAGDVPVSDPALEKGVRFLLRTQDADGSWFASKRAIPVNNYFDSDFPHGESQYASFNATAWATLALLEAAGKR
jgi:ankyrin repeat protein